MMTQRTFTARHMAFLMIGFFGVIGTVNVFMAMQASRTWSGLVVPNSYIASQTFDEDTAEMVEQASLGWRAKLSLDDGRLSYALSANERNLKIEHADLSAIRPVHDREGGNLHLSYRSDGSVIADWPFAEGIWILTLKASVKGRDYRDVRRIVVENGRLK